MILEDQCVNLELSRKIEELGVPQNSLFYWVEDVYRCGGYTGEYFLDKTISDEKIKKYYNEHRTGHYFSAFTCSELGEILRKFTAKDEDWWVDDCISYDSLRNKWYFELADKDPCADGNDFIWLEATSEADARAKMLIYLFENKLIK